MKMSIRKLALALLAVVILLPLAAYWLADRWLESSGGRQLLERTLTGRIGMDVKLKGDFDLMLLPDIGVSGTGLVVGGPDPESEFVSSREYEVSVALRPLFDRKVLLEWVRLTGVFVYPERYSQRGEGKQEAISAGEFRLPEIQEISIRDFQVVLPGEEETRFKVNELTITGFAENREAPFTLEIENLAAAEGSLRWDTAQSLVHFGNLRLDLEGQSVHGQGCLLLQTPRALHFNLQANVFDLDAFRESLPGAGGSGGEDGRSLPLETRIRFSADELRTSGAIAHGVVLNLGDEPTCE